MHIPPASGNLALSALNGSQQWCLKLSTVSPNYGIDGHKYNQSSSEDKHGVLNGIPKPQQMFFIGASYIT